MAWNWKHLGCIGFPEYEISEIGQLRRRDKIIVVDYNNNGYLRYNLWKENRQYHLLAHRLVGLVWVANPLLKPIINHEYGDRHDNYWRHLRWMTYKENNAFRYEMARIERELMKKETPF